MTRTLAIQMDPIESINPRSDSTLALGIEAQKRGYQVYYYTPEKLTSRDGRVTARGYPVTLFHDETRWFERGGETLLYLEQMDVVMLRQDPPFDMAYISSTYLLEQLQSTTFVTNNPTAVRNHPEKLFPFAFSQFMPPTLVTSDEREIGNFRKEFKDIIVKPVYGHGGRAVFRITEQDHNFGALLESLLTQSKEPLMVQPFLPEVKTQDRRIILADGKVAGVLGRIPAEHEIRANFRVGGTAAKAALTKRQSEICEALEPVLRDEGLLFVGLDVIGDWLTEINITSPTGIRPMNRLYGIEVEAVLWDAIESHL